MAEVVHLQLDCLCKALEPPPGLNCETFLNGYAYEESGGSMKALLVSLDTSDAFLYRTVERDRDR